MAKEYFTIYHYWVCIELGVGVKFHTRKYLCSFTGKNYIGKEFSDEDEKAGYSYPPYGRIKAEEINAVTGRGIHIAKLVSRSIFYLEGQKEEAEAKLHDAVSRELSLLKTQANAMWDWWVNRPKS